MNAKTPVLAIENLKVGMTAEYSRQVTGADIQAFADVTGDHNPVHTDETYAASTQFGKRIAHGILSVGFFSTVLGTKLPGPGCIYMSQSAKFKAPVFINDTVRAVVEITAIEAEKKRVTLSTNAYVGDRLVTTGEALMYIP
ncbi:MAG: hypothetical protein RL217_1705 [Pseudomonadota bacterium]|jgi:3-hydroxybutyryl-CoA dehydratase